MKPQAAAPVLPGETLAGKYRIERVLGKGGMGIVVAARHIELQERVAIKFLLGERAAVAVERFLREARAAAKVKSEHVCRVHDVARLETGEPYIVMEYLEGKDLGDKLESEGPLSVARAAEYVIEACAALAEAHAAGIVHRDLKPANLFLAERADGSTCVKVLDFGISKLPDLNDMTSTQVMMGSPLYMAPEQIASSRSVDSRADVWSLGVILHELVSGAPPFVADTMIQLAVKVREEEPPSLREVAPSTPPQFEAIVRKCLAKNPVDRYGSVSQLASDLAPFAAPDSAHLAARLMRARAASDPGMRPTMQDTPRERLKPAELQDMAPASAGTPPSSRAPSDDAPVKSGTATSVPPPGQVTFAPVDTSTARDATAARGGKRMVWIVGGIVLLGGALSFTLRHRQDVRAVDTSASATASTNVITPVSVAEAAPPAPIERRVDTATASAPLPPPLASAPPPPTEATKAPRRPTTHTIGAPPAAPESAKPAEPAAPPRAAESAAPAPAEPAKAAPEGTTVRKKRALDRSDPW